MRRISAILLLLAFSLPLIAAAFPNSDSTLPACCRRAGLHHCGMGHPGDDSSGSAAKLNTRPCPLFPATTGISPQAKIVLPGIAVVPALTHYHQSPTRPSLARAAASSHSWRHKRGPPSLLS